MNENDFFDKGVEYMSAKEMELAIKEFSKEIDINPCSIAAYLFRAACYFSIKQYDKSIEDCNKVLELDSTEIEGYILRAKNYIEIEKFNDAINDLDEAIKLDPVNVIAYNNRGFANAALGFNAIHDYGESVEFYNYALNDFNKSIEIDPDSENIAHENIKAVNEQLNKRGNEFIKAVEESGLGDKLYPPGYKFIVD